LREFKRDTRILGSELFSDILSSPHRDLEAPASNANGYRVDLGVDWNVTRKLRAELRYQSEYRGAANESVGVRAGVSYTW
jgi:hypothetical protein